MNVEAQIRQEVALVLARSATEFDSDRPLVEYGLDSVRAMEVVAGIEDQFDIRIEDHEIADLRTLADFVAFAQKKMQKVRP